MANDVRLKGGRDWTTTVRMESEKVELNPEDAVGAATAGKVIRDIAAGNFENMNNLAVVAGTFSVKDMSSQGPVVVGTNTIVVMEDPNNNNQRHELKDPAMVGRYQDAGMVIVETKTVDIMG